MMKRTSAEKADVTSQPKKTKVSLGKSTQVNVSPHQRSKEFPGEVLVVSSGKLFCDACHTEVALKKSIVKDYVLSERHKAGKEECRKHDLRQKRLMQSWEAYQQRHTLAGTGLSAAVPSDQRLRRIQTIQTVNFCDFLSFFIPASVYNPRKW